MTTTLFRAALSLAVCAGTALAQPGVQPPPPAGPPPGQAVFAPSNIPYQTLIVRDGNGKVLRISGCLDAASIQKNALIKPDDRAAMEPYIAEWAADVNQLVIDNLDFIEKIEGGFFEALVATDANAMKVAQTINGQLGSAGALTGRLVQKGVLQGQAAQSTVQMTNEYVQAVYAEIIGDLGSTPPNAPAAQQQADQQRRADAATRYYQANTCRDAREQYHRMLLDAAGMIDTLVRELPSEIRSKAEPRVAAVKAAPHPVTKMIAVRDMLGELTFAQRQVFLTKAVELGAAIDPFKSAPMMPAAPAPKAGAN